jgi:hypothetical protein
LRSNLQRNISRHPEMFPCRLYSCAFSAYRRILKYAERIAFPLDTGLSILNVVEISRLCARKGSVQISPPVALKLSTAMRMKRLFWRGLLRR